jgi:hypothetical protein
MVRAAVEVGVWAPHYFGGERVFLKQSFVKGTEILLEAGTGGPQPALNLRLRLPDSNSGSGGKQWIVEGLLALPTTLKPASIAQEKALYDTLVAELRSGLALDVESSPRIDRAVKQEKSGGGGALVTTEMMLICGGSNAVRLHKEMQEQGIAADLLHVPNLRVIRGTAELLAAKIKEVVAKRRLASIILQFLDNSVFETLTEEGSRIPPRKLDGTLHFDGDIVVAEKAAMTRMLRICRPAFNATEDIPTAMIGPLPRYVSTACCGDPEHMANRCTPRFRRKMRSELDGTNRTIKEFLHNDGYSNIHALDPWVCLRQLDVTQIWGADPVHIKKDHLQKSLRA